MTFGQVKSAVSTSIQRPTSLADQISIARITGGRQQRRCHIVNDGSASMQLHKMGRFGPAIINNGKLDGNGKSISWVDPKAR